MARSRNIKPGFFTNDRLAECDPLARLLFAGLWTIADREGRLEDRPKRIKAELLPYDECSGDALLAQLEQAGFILRYSANGERYIQILAFGKHQNPHKNEADSVIPPPLRDKAPEQHSTSTVQAPDQHSTNPADSLNLIPDSLNPPNPPAGGEEVGQTFGDEPKSPISTLEDQLLETWSKPDNQRIQYQIPVNWTCQTEELEQYLLLMHVKALVNGKRVTAHQITPEIMADFIRSNHADGRRLRHAQWVNKLAGYLVARIQAGLSRDGGQLLPENNPNFDYPLHVSQPRSGDALPAEEQRARIRLIRSALDEQGEVAA